MKGSKQTAAWVCTPDMLISYRHKGKKRLFIFYSDQKEDTTHYFLEDVEAKNRNSEERI